MDVLNLEQLGVNCVKCSDTKPEVQCLKFGLTWDRFDEDDPNFACICIWLFIKRDGEKLIVISLVSVIKRDREKWQWISLVSVIKWDGRNIVDFACVCYQARWG